MSSECELDYMYIISCPVSEQLQFIKKRHFYSAAYTVKTVAQRLQVIRHLCICFCGLNINSCQLSYC